MKDTTLLKEIRRTMKDALIAKKGKRKDRLGKRASRLIDITYERKMNQVMVNKALMDAWKEYNWLKDHRLAIQERKIDALFQRASRVRRV